MFGSEVLDVAIGLVFVYCMLSLVCTLVNEWIAGLFKLRAKTLEQGIANLLRDEERLQKFWDHPLIASLAGRARSAKPDEQAARTAETAEPAEPAKPAKRKRPPRPSYIPAATFAAALLETIARADAADTSVKTFSDVRNAVAGLPDHLKSALLPLLDGAERHLGVARTSIEQWFDSSMERVSGWYKRKVQLITLGVAVALALVVNADTVSIARTLYTDLPMRSSLVAMAEEAARQPMPPAGGGTQSGITYTGDPADSGPDPAGGAANGPAAGGQKPGDDAQGSANGGNTSKPPDPVATLASLQKKGLPLGWQGDSADKPATFGSALHDLSKPSKILGLLLTALAVSLGAPVWFDLLGKLVNLRAAGKAPSPATPPEPAASAKAKPKKNGE